MDSLLHISHPGKTGSENLSMDEVVNILLDHDIDMGVDRSFYDPVLRDQYFKKQEAEQNKFIELKKKQQQLESRFYTIDEETGERIPKPNFDKSLSGLENTEDSDLCKELAELGELAQLLDESANTLSSADNGNEYFNNGDSNSYDNTSTQYQSPEQNTEDIWATQITMLPGPSSCTPQPPHMSDMLNSQNSDLFMSGIWDDVGPSNSKPATDYFSAYTADSPAGVFQQSVAAVDPPSSYMTHSTSGSQSHSPRSTTTDYYCEASDSGIDETFSDQYAGSCSALSVFSQSFNEDIKPQINFNDDFCGQSISDKGGLSSSDEFGSSYENDDNRSIKSESERSKRNSCRDVIRCRELGIPFSVDVITNHPVEEFNALLRRHTLSEDQLSLIKDIRRRGKNKVAAQNCRKKKMNELTGLEEEINDLKRKRSELVRDKDDLKRRKLHLRSQLDQTYAEVFNSVRDHLGRPYDPHYYSLHITDEGEPQIIPNKSSPFSIIY